jgi:hypothetical protein
MRLLRAPYIAIFQRSIRVADAHAHEIIAEICSIWIAFASAPASPTGSQITDRVAILPGYSPDLILISGSRDVPRRR